MNSSFDSLSPQQLRRAADVKEKIDSLGRELVRLMGGALRTANNATAPRGRTMSAATRARIAAAARKRWANTKKGSKSGHAPKRQMSAAARARLSAIARARWKKVRAQGRNAL